MTAIDNRHTRLEIARLSDVPVFEIYTTNGKIPDAQIRDALYKKLTLLYRESLLIFLDKERTQSIWYWIKREDDASFKHEYSYAKGQPADLFLNKLDTIVSDLLSFQEKKDQRERTDLGLESNHIVEAFDAQRLSFTQLIGGIEDEQDRVLYAMILLSRLIFLYFLQRRGFLDHGCKTYLESHLEASSDDSYYRQFLRPLFDGLARPVQARRTDLQKRLGTIPYLNGGLFLPHPLELQYSDIQIPNSAFVQLLSLFSLYDWQIVDVPTQKGNEITPDILGNIFEMYFNRQSQNGPYSTPIEITEYFCKQTIHQIILDRVNRLSHRIRQRSFASIEDLLEDLDVTLCRHLLLEVLPHLSILDPACGSGAFLVAALNTLVLIYTKLTNRAEDFHNDQLASWLTNNFPFYPNRIYALKKRIITNNLFGVDIVDEAVELTRLRLYLALISSLENIEDLEPLPNIDFNLYTGNSLIGLLRVDDVRSAPPDLAIFYEHTVQERNELVASYRETPSYGEDLRLLRGKILHKRAEATTHLNEILLDQFYQFQHRYGRGISTMTRNHPGEQTPSATTIEDIKRLKPFHWCYDFDQVMNGRGGFDVVMTNPPWEILRPGSSASSYYQSLFYEFAPQYVHQHLPKKQRSPQTMSIHLYKLFVEQCYNLLCDGGYASMLVPTNICTDQDTAGLRKLLFTQTRLHGLFCFENRRYVFRGLGSRFEFALLTYEKGRSTDAFPATFSRQSLEDLAHFPDQNAIYLSMNFLQRFSPGIYSLGRFKNQEDVSIIEKMLRFPPLEEAQHDTWNVKLATGLSISAISHLELFGSQPDSIPLYEGKMIHQFTHVYAPPRRWVKKTDNVESANISRISRSLEQWQKSGYHGYHLAFRDISTGSNQRTLIATVLPPNVLVNNTINFASNVLVGDILLFLTAIFNSFMADFFIRQIVSIHVAISNVYHLSVPRLTKQDEYFSSLVTRTARLICTTEDFKELWESVMRSPWSQEIAATNSVEREQLRAELDGLAAHLYNLSEDEFTYILSTFPLVAAPTKIAAQNAYRDVKRGLIS